MRDFLDGSRTLGFLIAVSVAFSSCTTSGPSGLFGKKSPHEQYLDKIKNAGLQETALGRMWMQAAEQSLASPLAVNIPYSETGYFPADQPKAVGLLFSGKRGEKINISLNKKPDSLFAIYLDIWQAPTNGETTPKLLLSPDSINTVISYDVDKDGTYILRIQPELLKGGQYNLSVTAGPSLAFPVTPKVKSNIGSFWGVARDRGSRKHEGIDIFAPRGTALVAAADGVVTTVTENALGGKVVFLRPNNKNYTLYYAHLDAQLVQPGQSVRTGDTIGLVGNTGNARTTSPHLHFGIYTNSGAIDPLPFVNTLTRTPAKISASLNNLNSWLRNHRRSTLYVAPSGNSASIAMLEANTLLKAEAVTADWYKVTLPEGQRGFVQSANVVPATVPIRVNNLKTSQALLDMPLSSAAQKVTLSAGQSVRILGQYKDFYYVENSKADEGWVLKQNL